MFSLSIESGVFRKVPRARANPFLEESMSNQLSKTAAGCAIAIFISRQGSSVGSRPEHGFGRVRLV
jgi:hypothetical protein